jgi:type I restriction enzyme S subunit
VEREDVMHEGGTLPPEWMWTTLGEVADTTRMRADPQDYPDARFIGMEHVEAHTMRLLGTVPAKEMRSSAERFEPGDVLYGRLRPYLNKVLCPDFAGLCSGEFIIFRKTPHLESHYLQYFLNSADFVSFASHLNAGDRPRVNFEQLADYPFPLPPLPEQHRIVAEIEELFTQLDAGVAALKRVQANLKRYRASVLKAACEGRLAPQDPAEEPADRLLARILRRSIRARSTSSRPRR